MNFQAKSSSRLEADSPGLRVQPTSVGFGW